MQFVSTVMQLTHTLLKNRSSPFAVIHVTSPNGRGDVSRAGDQRVVKSTTGGHVAEGSKQGLAFEVEAANDLPQKTLELIEE
jgi:hypothetical protein